MNPVPSRKRLDTKKAAAYVDLSESTLNKKRVYGGGPKFLKLGRRVTYDTDDLDAWLDENRRASTSDLAA